MGNSYENVSTHNDLDDLNLWSVPSVVSAVTAIVGLYLYTVILLIPPLMKNREPYKLKKVLLFYNIFQVAFSLYIVFKYFGYNLTKGFLLTECLDKETLKSTIPDIYPYFIAKHIDLLDTVFFVLRKKDNQVTFLHLYHHSVMLGWTWMHLMHYPTDQFVFVGALNSLVHVVMYAYYGISSLGPEYAKFVWWKKHLTMVQLVQFVLVVWNLYYQQRARPCPIPAYFYYYCMTCIVSFFFLFMKFYFSSYKPRKTKKDVCEGKNSTENLDQNLSKSE